MNIQIGDYKINADIRDREIFPSKHTGANLIRQTITFSVQGSAQNESILELLKESKKSGVTSLSPAGDTVTWKIGNTKWSYTDGRPDAYTAYWHTWELEEKENLSIERLVIDDIEYSPYSYNEEFDGDTLVINSRVKLSIQDTVALRTQMKDKDYFSVIRRGINDEPRAMRFGRCLWSQQGDEIKYELILVDKAYDAEHRPLEINEPALSNIKFMLAETSTAFAELLSVLKEKEVLTDTEGERIKQKMTEGLDEITRIQSCR
jgi:hypothetical protein